MEKAVYISPLLKVDIDVEELCVPTDEHYLKRVRKIVEENKDNILDVVAETLYEKICLFVGEAINELTDDLYDKENEIKELLNDKLDQLKEKLDK